MTNQLTQKLHWVRRFAVVAILVLSLLFSVISAVTIGKYYSALNLVPGYNLVITVLIAVAFSVLGFFLSRAFAYCVQHKQPNGYVTFGVIAFEFVEVGACFSEAVHAVVGMSWRGYEGVMSSALHILAYLILSIFPVFTLLCGQLEVAFHREKYGQEVRAAQPTVPQYKSPLPPSARSAAPYAAPTRPYQAPAFNGGVPSAAPGTVVLPESLAPQPQTQESKKGWFKNPFSGRGEQGQPVVTTDVLLQPVMPDQTIQR
jgi:hypothetical protein